MARRQAGGVKGRSLPGIRFRRREDVNAENENDSLMSQVSLSSIFLRGSFTLPRRPA